MCDHHLLPWVDLCLSETLVSMTRKRASRRMFAAPVAIMTPSFSGTRECDSIILKPATVDRTRTDDLRLCGIIVNSAMRIMSFFDDFVTMSMSLPTNDFVTFPF